MDSYKICCNLKRNTLIFEIVYFYLSIKKKYYFFENLFILFFLNNKKTNFQIRNHCKNLLIDLMMKILILINSINSFFIF